MAIPTRIDQVEQGSSRLLEQFKGKPNIENTLAAYTKQADVFERAAFDFFNKTSLDLSVGVNLDHWGELVGEERLGRGDDLYRTAIKFKIAVNNSQGTPEGLISTLQEVTESSDIQYIEHYPRSYMMSFDGTTIPDNFVSYFQDASPVTTTIGLLHDKDNGAWRGSDIGEAEPTKIAKASFGDLGDTGGVFFSDLYNNGLGGSGSKGFDISQYFSLTNYLATGLESTHPININIAPSENSIYFISNITDSTGYQVITSNIPSSPTGRVLLGSGGVWSGADIDSFSANSINLLNNTTGLTNSPLSNYSVAAIKQKSKFCSITPYTGAGQVLSTFNHILDNEVGFIFITKVSGATGNSPIYWFKGMSADTVITNSGLLYNPLTLGSTTPTSREFTVGFDDGVRNTNELNSEYIALLFSDDAEFGTSVGSYIGDDQTYREIELPFEAGWLLVTEESTGKTIVVNSKAGVTRANVWDTNANLSTIDSISFVNLKGKKFAISDSSRVNSLGETYRYIALENPIKDLKSTDEIVGLNERFAITSYDGNSGGNTTVNLGIDMFNDGGALISWRTDFGGYINFFQQGMISTTGIKGSRYLIQDDRSPLYNLDYTTTGFTMSSATSAVWNSSNNYTVAGIKNETRFANTFSYVGDGLSQAIPHGLDIEPLTIIICPNEQTNPVMWHKDLTAYEFLNEFGKQEIGSIWNGKLPDKTNFYVNNIGGQYDLNRSGVEYNVFVLADNPEAGITGGTYTGSTLTKEVDVGNKLGLFYTFSSNSRSLITNKQTNLLTKDGSIAQPTTGQVTGVNIEETKVVLAPNAFSCNSDGFEYFWFNIADPNQ